MVNYLFLQTYYKNSSIFCGLLSKSHTLIIKKTPFFLKLLYLCAKQRIKQQNYYMKSTVKLLFVFFIFSKAIFAQTNLLPVSTGFLVLESKTEISSIDKSKIEEANFDEYRFYNLRKKIQLVRGPLIELLSIKELEQKGKTFPKSLVDNAKLKSESFKHESIGNIDLGLGIKQIYEPK